MKRTEYDASNCLKCSKGRENDYDLAIKTIMHRMSHAWIVRIYGVKYSIKLELGQNYL